MSAEKPRLGRFAWLEEEPDDYYDNCKQRSEEWKKVLIDDSDTVRAHAKKTMNHFVKMKSIIMVTNNKLGKDLPKELKTDHQTFSLLQQHFDCNDEEGMIQLEAEAEADISQKATDAEEGKASKLQSFQRMKALKFIMNEAKREQDLSEELIKKCHKIMMEGLTVCDGSPPKPRSVRPGEYRTEAVFANEYVFPEHEVVPNEMQKLVEDYNIKAGDDKYNKIELAAWLFYELISLHPFLDGNGRTCRLLLCFSLMRHGLPFPFTLSSGHKKSYKHYIDAIQKSQSRPSFRPGGVSHAPITTLTVVSQARNQGGAWGGTCPPEILPKLGKI